MNDAPVSERAASTQRHASTTALAFLEASIREQQEIERHAYCVGRRQKCAACNIREVRRAVEHGAIASGLTYDPKMPEYRTARSMAIALIAADEKRRQREVEDMLAQRILRGEVAYE